MNSSRSPMWDNQNLRSCNTTIENFLVMHGEQQQKTLPTEHGDHISEFYNASSPRTLHIIHKIDAHHCRNWSSWTAEIAILPWRGCKKETRYKHMTTCRNDVISKCVENSCHVIVLLSELWPFTLAHSLLHLAILPYEFHFLSSKVGSGHDALLHCSALHKGEIY